jgi:hypothetical protein
VYTDARLPKAVNAVLFDIENWGNTPGPERKKPINYISRAAADVASYNKRTGRHVQFIAAPAPDLTTAVMPPHWVDNKPFPTNYTGYLKLGLAGNAARVSNAIDIQGQQIENTPKEWGAFVAAAAAQAKKANSKITILVGLTLVPKTYSSTNPISSQQLGDAYCQERSYNGYWLNIAAGTANNPLKLLRQVLADNGNGCPTG